MADNNNDEISIDRLAVMAEYEVSRRSMLRAGVLGVGGLGLTALLAACGTSNGPSHSSSSPSASGGKAKRGGNLKQTRLRKIEGDIAALRAELQEALKLDEKECVVNQLTKHIIIKVSLFE